ncbi:hypothetical protein [Nocardioides sp. B-3]|uniref:hypothetical protein n=1 Tax=Nocardioides sp. B-3 TaxID=2895565 RepID=UPI003FA52571
MLLLGLLLTGGIYTVLAPARAQKAQSDTELVEGGPQALPRGLCLVPRPERRGHLDDP